MKDLLTAFRAPSFPCNPLPFINALYEGVRTNGSDWIKSAEARSLLHIINSQAHGQLYFIDSLDEFNYLNKTIEP
jgi:hypothetical protein